MKKINGDLLRDMVISAANNIEKNKAAVNDLNVFPVPDGDTGTNMSLTMSVAAAELKKLSGATVGEVAALTASTLLKAARGNSGVILSLLFRGIAKGLAGHTEVDGVEFSAALKMGVDAAYKAVMKPTEGTILTVSRVAAEQGSEMAKTNADTVAVMTAILEGAKETLAKTPDMLPVLKQAGVVDAGGAGFVIIFEGMQSVLKDGIAVERTTEEATNKKADLTTLTAEDIAFGYCTEFIINREKNLPPERLRAYLESMGDSVLVADDVEIIKVHVHTNHPGKALEEALKYGYLTNLKIENMREQFENEKKNREEEKASENAAPDLEKAEIAAPEKKYGFVAVSAGAGITQLFCDLGADNVVFGGQTMNPCTEDILIAVNKTPAQTVFVLPNNKNIVFAAQMAIALTEKEVVVIPTGSVPEGISAILSFDPDADTAVNVLAMNEVIASVKTGQVTYAVRDSEMDGVSIKEGQYMGLHRGKLLTVGTDLFESLTKLVDGMVDENSIILTLYYGSDVSEADATKAYEALSEKYSGKLDISLVNGGQPVYFYIVSVE